MDSAFRASYLISWACDLLEGASCDLEPLANPTFAAGGAVALDVLEESSCSTRVNTEAAQAVRALRAFISQWPGEVCEVYFKLTEDAFWQDICAVFGKYQQAIYTYSPHTDDAAKAA